MTTSNRTGQPMSEHVIALDTPLPEILAAEFAKRVYFAAEEISDFRLIGDGDHVTAVAVTTVDGVLPDGLGDKLRFVLRNDVLPQLIRDPKVIWSSPAQRTYPADTFDRLVAIGAAYPVGEGQVALGSPLLELMDDLDRVLRRLVVEEFGGHEFRYPTLIPIDALDRCDYFTSFPQFAMFATRLRSDVDNYREFLDRVREGGRGIGSEILEHCSGVDYCLPPTMCYHTFNQFTGTTVAHPVVTAKGKSFRHEARYHRSLARLWDFTIREIVFLGTREEVLAARERFLHQEPATRRDAAAVRSVRGGERPVLRQPGQRAAGQFAAAAGTQVRAPARPRARRLRRRRVVQLPRPVLR